MFTFNNLVYTYDSEVDALSFKITGPYIYKISLEASPNLILDIADKVDRVAAFEILDASRVFNISKKGLGMKKDLKASITVNVTIDVIITTINISVNGEIGSCIGKTVNNNDVVPGNYKYFLIEGLI